MLAVAGVPYCTARELYDVSWSYYVELKAPAEKALDMLVAWKETPKVMIALTPQFIRRCVVGLLCICQVSVERIVEFFDEVFCYHISKGSVGRIQEEARQKAEGIERDVSLRGVKYVAMDEIFQQGQPVLTGVDLQTHYVVLAQSAPDRTGETWREALEEKKANDLHPRVCVSDAGSGLLKGVSGAFPEITMQMDVFHALRDVGAYVIREQRRAMAALSELCELENKLKSPKVRQKTRKRYEELSATINDTLHKADTLRILYEWLKEMTAFSGYGYEKSFALCVWILEQMAALFPERKKYQQSLSSFRNHLPDILKFLRRLQDNLRQAAQLAHMAEDDLMLLYHQRAYPLYSKEYAAMERRLFQRLGNRILEARQTIDETIRMTFRASSMIENVNSRIRCYMNLKRNIPSKFLSLLRFYFNTRKANRPTNKSWAGTSALDRLTGHDNPSFLNLLFGCPDYLFSA